MAATRPGSGVMPAAFTRWPRKSMDGWASTHLSGLAVSLAARRRANTSPRCPVCSCSPLLKTKMSSRYGKAKSRSAITRSISRWKVLPEFLMPKVILVNSHRPNGVVMAVLGMSAGFIGTWWYPLFRSILEKIVQPAALAAKSIMFGIG